MVVNNHQTTTVPFRAQLNQMVCNMDIDMHIRLAPSSTQVYKKIRILKIRTARCRQQKLLLARDQLHATSSLFKMTARPTLPMPRTSKATRMPFSTANHDDIHLSELATQPDKAGASYGLADSALQPCRPPPVEFKTQVSIMHPV